MIALLLLACATAPVDSGGLGPDDLGEPDVLSTPDLSDAELALLAQDALALAIQVTGHQPWLGASDALAPAEDGCPDVYSGDLPSYAATEPNGWGWEDACSTSAGVRYEGYLWWLSEITVNGELGGSPPGRAIAQRFLTGEATVSEGLSLRYGFNGTQEESLDVEVGRESFKWTYGSDIDVVATGTDSFTEADPTPNGWRASGTLTTHGGDTQDISLAMEAWFFGPVLDDRLDALSVNIDWSKEDSGDTCQLEPFGSMSVRLTDGTWLDLVFLDESGSALSPTCDGCATLYVRGLESGTVCADMSFLWDGRLVPPSLDTFALSARDIGLGP